MPPRTFLATSIQYQKQPKLPWTVIRELTSNTGGLNAGIFQVRSAKDPLGRIFIEKRFKPTEFDNGIVYREIQLLFQISDHPHIPRMIDHFVDNVQKKASVYMENCELGSLEKLIGKVDKEHRVNEHKVWMWFIQAMEALVYCHRGPEPDNDKSVLDSWCIIYHRDIKPANILLTRKDDKVVAKLADFGCAISAELTFMEKKQVYASSASAMTEGFDPPEHPNFEGRSDIWQMGMTMLCLCTGLKDPRSTRNPEGQKWDPETAAGEEYSNELNAVLRWCLTKDVTKRPRSFLLLQRLKESYDSVKRRLPVDENPLQLLDEIAKRPPDSARSRHVQGQNKTTSDRKTSQQSRSQAPPRPGPPGHVLSDPGPVRNRVVMSYADLVGQQRSPRDITLRDQPAGRSRRSSLNPSRKSKR